MKFTKILRTPFFHKALGPAVSKSFRRNSKILPLPTKFVNFSCKTKLYAGVGRCFPN